MLFWILSFVKISFLWKNFSVNIFYFVKIKKSQDVFLQKIQKVDYMDKCVKRSHGDTRSQVSEVRLLWNKIFFNYDKVKHSITL